MNYWTDYPTDIIDILITLVGFGALLIPVLHKYRKNKEELSIWKVLLITFIGMFTFDFTLQISGERALLPLLPIGVWLVYGGFRLNNKEIAWKRYRPFAWIGFISSFFFFFLGLLGAFLDGQIYDRDELATYIASVQEPQLVVTHPFGEKQTLKEDLESLNKSFFLTC